MLLTWRTDLQDVGTWIVPVLSPIVPERNYLIRQESSCRTSYLYQCWPLNQGLNRGTTRSRSKCYLVPRMWEKVYERYPVECQASRGYLLIRIVGRRSSRIGLRDYPAGRLRTQQAAAALAVPMIALESRGLCTSRPSRGCSYEGEEDVG